MPTPKFDTKINKTKDTDKDGTPDYQDPAPTNPLIPAKSDLGDLGKYGKDLGVTGVVPPVVTTTTPTTTPTTGSGGGGGGGGSNTSSVRTWTTEQAKVYAETAFQNAIGRAPTQQELLSFRTHLNNAELANPTTTTYSGTSSKTTGGLDEAQFTKTQAELHPEYAGYQKATTYFDAMMNTLSGPAGGSV